MTTAFMKAHMASKRSGLRRRSFRAAFVLLGILTVAPQSGFADAPTNTIPGVSTNAPDSTKTNTAASSKFFDPEDGWLDVSGFLDTAYGFLPIAAPITEPAVGYGAAGGLLFIDRDPNDTNMLNRPSMAAVGGLGTDNGTGAAFGAYRGSFFDNKLETRALATYGAINLKFYGIGDSPLKNDPVPYTLRPIGGLVDFRYRIGDSPLQAGIEYRAAQMSVSFDGTLPGQVSPLSLDSRVAALKPTITYDNRDNIFTPNKGLYSQGGVEVYNGVFGSDWDFEKIDLSAIYYTPLAETVTLGWKVETKLSVGDAPFYLRPSIDLRGVTAMRYMGDYVADEEVELRWQFWRRFSLVGFTGLGIAWNDFSGFDDKLEVVSGGVGFRYELARKYGLHMGADVGFGPNGPAVYVQFGSAWFR